MLSVLLSLSGAGPAPAPVNLTLFLTKPWLFPWPMVLSGQDKPPFLPMACHAPHLAICFPWLLHPPVPEHLSWAQLCLPKILPSPVPGCSSSFIPAPNAVVNIFWHGS